MRGVDELTTSRINTLPFVPILKKDLIRAFLPMRSRPQDHPNARTLRRERFR